MNDIFKVVVKVHLFMIAVMCAVGISWLVNLFKLTECDFNAPYRCETVHGIGIFPPAALVTVWLETDKDTK